MSTAISVDRLSKRFGHRDAVNDLSFELPHGGVTGFLGANGSGKSTTIRMLLGLIRPTSGSATVLGHSVATPHRFVDRVGALIDSPALYPSLSGRDTLRVYAELGGVERTRIDAVLDIVGLRDRDRDKAKTYSLGMKQRLAIAIALLRDPQLLLLDEPTNGLDPEGIVEVRNLIKQLGVAGHTVLVSSHVLAEMQAACDRFVVIRQGRLLFTGTSDELLARGPQRVIARPHHPSDLDRLRRVLRDRGFAVEVTGGDIRVAAGAARAAELNRIAFDAGIVLGELVTRHDDLENVFLHLNEDDQ